VPDFSSGRRVARNGGGPSDVRVATAAVRVVDCVFGSAFDDWPEFASRLLGEEHLSCVSHEHVFASSSGDSAD